MVDDAFTPLEPLDELTFVSPAPVDVDAMLEQLYHPDPNLRMQAARIFCDIEEVRARERLVDLLQDPCPLVRVSAAYALGRNVDATLVDRLLEALRMDWNGYVRKGVVWALGNAQDPRSLPLLMHTLVDDITAVRLWAASALGQVTRFNLDPAITRDVVTALGQAVCQDPVAAVRSNCAWALGKVGESLTDRELKEIVLLTLHRACEDADLGVVDDAHLALEKLGVAMDPGEL